MAKTGIEICSTALVMIGAQPITSFEDGTTESNVAKNLYEDTVRDLLTRHRWRFASGQAQISRRSESPLDGWDSAYQLPADMLCLHNLKVNGHSVAYDRYQNLAYCNADEADQVIADYTFRADEDLWPPYFVSLVEMYLASLFAYSVANQVQTADYLDKKALRQLALARNIDSQEQTTRRLDMSLFTRVRRTIG
jgi:hypothetical protein